MLNAIADAVRTRKALSRLLAVRQEVGVKALSIQVPYYCAKGFDSFDKTILTSKALSKEKAHDALKVGNNTTGSVSDIGRTRPLAHLLLSGASLCRALSSCFLMSMAGYSSK